MGSYLQGADIHDFLSCLGKHAVENAAFGFPNLKTKKSECYNIVFVEDTDELAHCADGFGLANEEEKKVTAGEWGESIQKEEISGWGMEPDNEVKNDAIPANTGWAMTDDPPVDVVGWGGNQMVVSDSMVENEVDRKAPAPFEGGGWTDKQAVVSDDGWESMSKSEVNKTAPAARTDNWDSREGQNPPDGGQKGKLMHPSRRLMNAANDSTENHGVVSERRSGSFEPSGTNTVPLGRRRNFGLVNKEEKKATSGEWGESIQKEEKSGWGMEPRNESKNDAIPANSGWAMADDPLVDVGGWGGDQVAVSDYGWDSMVENEVDRKAPAPFEGGGWTDKQAAVSDDGWDSMSKSEVNKTAPAAQTDNWDSMEGQNPPDGGQKGKLMHSSRRLMNAVNDSTENHVARSERRSGSFEPSGTNTVPLGRRKYFAKADVSAGLTEVKEKEEDIGWGTCEPSRGHLEQDGPPRPKKFNRGPTDNSWAGIASNSPEPQSRRSRLRALINVPAYSELNELYKVANKILHHNEYQPGDKLNPEDDKFILEKILVHHRDKEEKVGCGVDYVMIDYHAEHQVSCFWVVRKDGSKTDFSYWKCLEGLFEAKYSQGATKDIVKEEAKDGWNWGANSAAPTKRVCDKKDTKDGWDLGASSAGTQNSWNMGASFAATTKTMCDQEEAKDSWDMRAGSAAPNTRSMGDQVATRGVPEEEAKDGCARDSWDMGADSAAPPESMCDQIDTKGVPEEETKDGWEGF